MTVRNNQPWVANGTISANAAGDIWITEQNGEMLVGGITSTSGDVALEADSISALNTTSLIQGASIELSAHAGAIGSQAQALRLDVGVVAGDTLVATALDSIYLEEINSDLLLESVTSLNGDLAITVG
ncbi:MAG: hypothetical protein IH848_08495, partial [Acidobacteria bacterium]|nr:hypothetical protein [Acidobacteriota bacterium]